MSTDTNTERHKLLHRIRSLLAKTVDNGCTESEAMAALSMAQAMMDTHVVSDAEVLETAASKAEILHTSSSADHNSTRKFLSRAIAEFTRTRAWSRRPYQSKETIIVFCGLPSDTEFASWLLDTLDGFVRAEMLRYLIGTDGITSPKEAAYAFSAGCAQRISARLAELAAASRPQTSNAQALVVTTKSLIAKAMSDAGIHLSASKPSRGTRDGTSYAAGRAAGDRASFGRPVGSGGTLRLK